MGSFKGGDPLEDWTWGLSLIALTMAMHATGVIFMALAGVSIRARIESQNHLTLRRVAAIQIGLIGTVGLLLAALHGVEAALWAAAYWWLGALNSPADAILLCRLDEHTRRFGADAGAPLADDGGTGGNGRYAAVRHQYSLHLRDHAGLLVTHDPPPSLTVDPSTRRAGTTRLRLSGSDRAIGGGI